MPYVDYQTMMRIAAAAGSSPKTVKKYIEGKVRYRAYAMRIERGLKQLHMDYLICPQQGNAPATLPNLESEK
jgi:predicted transcriptional regulator